MLGTDTAPCSDSFQIEGDPSGHVAGRRARQRLGGISHCCRPSNRLDPQDARSIVARGTQSPERDHGSEPRCSVGGRASDRVRHEIKEASRFRRIRELLQSTDLRANPVLP
jgi:hypothetical protein